MAALPARPRRHLVALVTGATLAASTLGSAPGALAVTVPPLLVTEIAPDNSGADEFEFVEVTNTTDEQIDLSAAKISYTYVDSADTSKDVPLSVPDGTTIEPGETLVLWLSYTSSTVDSFARTGQEFRDHWAGAGATGSDYRLVRLTGQAGMANGGGRGIRITTDGQTSWSYYASGTVGAGRTAHYRVDDTPSATSLLAGPSVPSPGEIAPEALEPSAPEDEEGPQPDPDLTTAALQITELTPDSSNVGGADAYEFIEVYNATSEPIDFADYRLDYLYPADDLTNVNVSTWPSRPREFLIQPGETVVFWIKNGPNDDLTATDFNAHYGTDLEAGTELVEISSGGMANASPRGLEILTNTGFSLNKAYYNLDGADDTAANVGIHYATDPADQGRQKLLTKAAATPGSVTGEQVPSGLMIPPADSTAPVITDKTADEVDASTDFPITLDITDDVQVRTATLTVQTSGMTEPSTYNLEVGEDGSYSHLVHRADLTGQKWVEYAVTATDGARTTTLETRRVPVAGVDTSPVRLSVEDGEFVSGTERLTVGGDTYPSTATVTVDGSPLNGGEASLEGEPVFAFEAMSTDSFFRNGVLIGEEVLHVFDEGFYDQETTVPVEVPLSHITQGDPLTLSVYAGTKAWPKVDPDENNDDFQIRNLRLVLPDGRTLRPQGYEDGTAWIPMATRSAATTTSTRPSRSPRTPSRRPPSTGTRPRPATATTR